MANEIQIGSIIHLRDHENGYLNTRGYVKHKAPFWNVAGTEHLFVMTFSEPGRGNGTGSWRIVSADGKADGEPLKVGDKIHLLNQFPDAGYLDSCGWVEHLPPFRAYISEVRTAVFTSHFANRDNGSGVWQIEVAGKKSGERVYHDDVIHLENCHPENGRPETGDFSRAGFLVSHGMVSESPYFKDYHGQLKFVFTSVNDADKQSAGAWTILLEKPETAAKPASTNMYFVWGMIDNEWIDFGAFELRGRAEPVTALNVRSTGEGEGDELEGTITFGVKSPAKVTATWHDQNEYTVDHSTDGWQLGGREDRKIVEIDLFSRDNGYSLTGTIQYAGESSIPFKGLRATTPLAYDFFQPSLWQARIKRMKEALETAVDEFDDVLFTAAQFSVEEVLNLISTAGGESYKHFSSDYFRLDRTRKTNETYADRLEALFSKIGDDAAIDKKLEEEANIADRFGNNIKLDHLNEKIEKLLKSNQPNLPISAAASTVSAAEQFDTTFQLQQLLNIYSLWFSMDHFWQELGERANETVEKLNQAKILPPVHLLRACFRQFTIDFEAIQNCIRQRRWVSNASADADANIQAASLIITDKLAARALAPFKHLINDAVDIVPLTFFSNKVHVRQLPYTDKFIFVGLTYDLTQRVMRETTAQDQQENRIAATPPFELLAIPHEIGHFVYRYVKLINQQDSDATFAKMTEQFEENPYYTWCEEIFADLYGCLIAGPFAVLGMQALIATEEKRMVIEDDDEHPTGIFRPYFLSEMLRVLTKLKSDLYDFEQVAELLDENWTAILQRWGYVAESINENGRPARIHLPTASTNHTESFVNVDKALQLVTPIIDKFARELISHAKFEPSSETNKAAAAEIPWCIGNDAENASLTEYIEGIKSLTNYKYGGGESSGINLSSKAHMRKSLRESMKYALEGRSELVGSKLFEEILIGWGDKGPTGFGGH